MKKTIILLFILMMLPMVASAFDFEKDGVYYNLVSQQAEITAQVTNNPNKYAGSVIIPASVMGYRVTSIGNYAFGGCSGLTSITIPNSVTSIGEHAFYNCSGLTSITIPGSVTFIDTHAFYGSSGLTSVHISDLEAWCSILFNGSTTNPLLYANHLYLNGEEIKDLVIPNSMTSISSYAFYGCTGLTSITIPNSVTKIGGDAFCGCI